MRTLCDILDRVRRDDRPDLLRVRPAGAAAVRTISARRFLERVDGCARALSGFGVGRGDRVGLISENRPDWHVVDFACHRLGAVPVPVYTTLTSAEAGYILGDAGCVVVAVDGAEQLGKLLQAVEDGEMERPRRILVMDPPAETPVTDIDVVALEAAIADAPADADLAGPEGPEGLATLIYTSGTTGPPKGVMLTHANLLANVDGLARRNSAGPTDIGLSLLPLSHAFERTVDYAYLAQGASLAYSSPAEVSVDFRIVRPTVMIGVPRLYEKLRAAVEARVLASGGMRRWLVRTALDLGRRRVAAGAGESALGVLDRVLAPLAEWLVLSRIREATGGRLRLLSCGGAALDPELNRWFLAAGWNLVQGYGLTESAPIIAANAPEDNRIGSVGRPLDNVEVRIAEDGEVLTRGPQVMKGYWNAPKATAEVLIGGWLHTGDMGALDADGYLYITDRKKAVLVTSTGKKVAPQPLENTLLRSPYLEQIMVVGEDRKFVAALIVPDYDRLRTWARRRGLPTDRATLATSAEVRALIQRELDRLQEDMAPYERVREFRILEEPFSIQAGQLTPTLKIVRRKVAADYRDRIEEMYGD